MPVFNLILYSLICQGIHGDERFSNETAVDQHENWLEIELLSLTAGMTWVNEK
jgi:hypothetical protein